MRQIVCVTLAGTLELRTWRANENSEPFFYWCLSSKPCEDRVAANSNAKSNLLLGDAAEAEDDLTCLVNSHVFPNISEIKTYQNYTEDIFSENDFWGKSDA